MEKLKQRQTLPLNNTALYNLFSATRGVTMIRMLNIIFEWHIWCNLNPKCYPCFLATPSAFLFFKKKKTYQTLSKRKKAVKCSKEQQKEVCFLGFKYKLEGILFSKSKNIPEASHNFSFPQSRPLLFLIRPSPTSEHHKPELEVK